jgi:hypothetical protein
LDIPNPYSIDEVHRADKRWKKLHKNAVPALIEFKEEGAYIDENKRIKPLLTVVRSPGHDGNWGF